VTSEQFLRVGELYHAALELVPEARAGFLSEACVGEDEIRREVESLLQAREEADGFIAGKVAGVVAEMAAQQNPSLLGKTVSHYQVLSMLGAGGMGEVYLAQDIRLRRKVALKLLPRVFARDQEWLRRFKQEALATSALNHPNIMTVYDIGEYEGAPFIVAELLEGEELRKQLKEGPLSVRRGLEYARQIAAGLAAAHEKGVVHRDLKPENLFVTKDGLVKILDFGLAKLMPQRSESSGLVIASQSQITNPGVVMGTAGYMSPEQVRGQEADHRSDIFSFGLILYEMLAGRRAFQGESSAETMAAIVKEEPRELTEANPKIPPQLERLVMRCLEKQPARRFSTASDLGFALESLSTPSGARLETAEALSATAKSLPVTGKTGLFGDARLVWVVALGLLLSTLSLAVAYFRRAPAESHATFTYLPLPEKTTPAPNGAAVLSPDGGRVVLTASAEGGNRLWLYSFERPALVLLTGTEGARFPFWSPDGRSIGFFAQGKLKRIEAGGGLPATLCDAPNGLGGAWSSTGVILFAPVQYGQGIYRVAESGGAATLVTTLDAARLEIGHNFPSFLPDGRHFVFFVSSGQPEYRGIRLGSLDQPQTSFLLATDTSAEYASAGSLLFVRGRKIVAQPFDAEKLTLSGKPMTVTEQVHYEAANRYAGLSVVGDKLLYRSADNLNNQVVNGNNLNTRLVWFDRSGRQLAKVGPASEYRSLTLSPDGSQVILERNDPQVEFSDLWLGDLRRETFSRLTSNPTSEFYPIWSPDGRRAVFSSLREGFGALWQKGVSLDDKEERLLKEDSTMLFTCDWSKDGRFIVYHRQSEKTGFDIGVLPLAGDRQPWTYLATQFNERMGKVSPDGRWLAYESNESGRYEIYVQSFPEPGRKVTVSQGGGQLPIWRRDGQELYYISPDDKLMAVQVQTGPSFVAGAPAALFELGSYSRRNNRYGYDVSGDGQKFLVLRPLEDASARPLTVVQNWMELLKK
jgi:Tol biopolymer transport system component